MNLKIDVIGLILKDQTAHKMIHLTLIVPEINLKRNLFNNWIKQIKLKMMIMKLMAR